MRRIVLAGSAALTVALALGAWTASGRDKIVDEGFVNDATKAGLAEVKLGKLAEDRGSTERVRSFGKQMVEDHKKIDDELAGIAKKKGCTCPTEPNAEQKETIDRIGKLSGGEFDREYLNVMLSEHQKAKTLFETESKSGEDKDLRDFAKRTLPVIEHHLKMVQELNPAKTKP